MNLSPEQMALGVLLFAVLMILLGFVLPRYKDPKDDDDPEL